MSAWPVRGRGRARQRPQKTGKMNRTEASFAAYLEVQRQTGALHSWEFEPFRLRLGDDWKTSYTPDFLVVLDTWEMVLVEVKGAKRDKVTGRFKAYWQEGSTEKYKWARQRFPMFNWMAVRPWGKGEPDTDPDRDGRCLLPNHPWVVLEI